MMLHQSTYQKKGLLVLRDPIDRFCSAFYFRINRLATCSAWIKEENKEVSTPDGYIKYLRRTKSRWNSIMSMRSYSKSVAGHPIEPVVWVFQPQSLWFRTPDTVFLQDNLDDEWYAFCNYANIPFVELSRSNARVNSGQNNSALISEEAESYLRHIYSGDLALWETWKSRKVGERMGIQWA
ncbi:MAG TPA: hypothetical protein QF700_00450 [Prochlorococcus sp.]|nr:hypothetical protein [Prochlorococcus sp.]